MLVLQRKVGEVIEIGENIRVVVLAVRGGDKVRLGVLAPRELPIDRHEIAERKRAQTSGDGIREESGMNSIQTRHRIAFSLDAPRVEDVHIHDIAHSLAHLCRFNGHTRTFYSVAEHSLRCSQIVEPEFALDALLHDAAEAYLGDVTSPVKAALGPAWSELETRVASVVADAFGLLWPIPRCVHNADQRMLATEVRDLLGPAIDGFAITAPPLLEPICDPWSPSLAAFQFLNRFLELTEGATDSRYSCDVMPLVRKFQDKSIDRDELIQRHAQRTA